MKYRTDDTVQEGPLPDELHSMLANPETPGYAAYDRFLEAGITAMTVYLLTAEEGTHSDVESWPIATFLTMEAAEKYRNAVVAEKRQLRASYMTTRSTMIWEDCLRMYSSVLDTKADPGSYLTTGHIRTQYEIVEIELKVGKI
jgi:hypothetical protein